MPTFSDSLRAERISLFPDSVLVGGSQVGVVEDTDGTAPAGVNMHAARPLLCVLTTLSIALSGCVTWRPYDATLSEGQRLPSYLRATRHDSSQVSFTDPFIRGDTLYGRVDRGNPVYGRAWGDSVGLPVADIAHLERERVSIGRTLGVVVGVPAAFLGVTYLVVCFNGCSEPTY